MTSVPTKIYVNPHKRSTTNSQSKIHVNPNFKQSLSCNNSAVDLISNFTQAAFCERPSTTPNIHVNPAKILDRKIHVNPKFVNLSTQCIIKKSVENPKLVSKESTLSLQSDKHKVSRTKFKYESVAYKKLMECKTCYYPDSSLNGSTFVPLPKTTSGPKSSKRLKTQYKLVNDFKTKSSKKVAGNTVVSKYKIVRDSNLPRKSVVTMKYKMSPNKFRSVSTKKKISKPFILINGQYYKSSKNKLCKLPSKTTIYSKKFTKPAVGEKYCLNMKYSLKRISNKPISQHLHTVPLGRFRHRQMPQNYVFRKEASKAFNVATIVKLKSINILQNKFKKSNQDCVFYRKFGYCTRKSKGLCHYRHDPNRIVLCKQFIRGQCFDLNCRLSHKIAPEKMPTCSFFLKGMCSKELCPYLHVKVNPNAKVCQEFLNGFCQLGDKCKLRHSNICSEYEAKGKCSQVYCCLEHKLKKRKIGSKKVTTSEWGLSCDKKHAVSKEIITTIKSKQSCSKSGTIKPDNDRYFVSPNNLAMNDTACNEFIKEGETEFLPSFISLKEYDSE